MSRDRVSNVDRFQWTTGAKRLCFVAALVFAPLASRNIALAQAPSTAPMEGFWTVQGRAVPGTRCADWSVSLALEQGRLTGVVGVGQGNVILQNLVLGPDGSFSGNTVAGHVNNRSVRAYSVTGRISGDVVSVTLKNEICPDRSGSARRHIGERHYGGRGDLEV
jgi:hypothetical protein